MAKAVDNVDYEALVASERRRVDKEIKKLYQKAVDDAARLGLTLPPLDAKKPLKFKDYASANKSINRIIKRLNTGISNAIARSCERSWALAEQRHDTLIHDIATEAVAGYYEAHYSGRNDEARAAFTGLVQQGFVASSRVWNNEMFKTELEAAMDLALQKGQSATSLAREIRQYLNNPDALFRRVRDKHGNLVLSANAKAYHPGQGVYRSAYKNALRYAGTSTNMAYRTSDSQRSQQEDFVVGIKIHLSNHHSAKNSKGEEEALFDICDILQGEYPKDFVWVGWHSNCRCFMTTILKTDEELRADRLRILRGEPPLPPEASKNYVADTPQAFKDWIVENDERLARSASLPYFVRDNAQYVNSALTGEPVHRAPSTVAQPALTALQQAEARHAARTPEQVADIKQRWEDRRKHNEKIKFAANNVLAKAKDYQFKDISASYTALEDAIQRGDIKAMEQELRRAAKGITFIRQQEAALGDVIPNVHEWHKQFSLSELQGAHDAVKAKLNDIAGLPLEEQQKLITKEINYVTDENYLKPHKLHSTWKVAEEAYFQKFQQNQYQIGLNKINDSLAQVKAWAAQHPKATNLAALLNDTEATIAKGGDINLIQLKANAAIAEYNHKLRSQARRDARKLLKGAAEDFGPECFSQERKDKAFWARTAEAADDHYHANAVDWWPKVTDDEKEALWEYTSGSAYITEPLRGIEGYYYRYERRMGESERHIKDMTTALSKSRLVEDIWIKRDAGSWNLNYIFGIDLNDYINNPAALVGKVGLEDSFQSCGSCRETRFTCTGTKDVIMNLYCPKGTQAVYAQPWSSCGSFGRRWDGIKKSNPSSGSENEVLLQRGAKMRITKAEYDAVRGRWYIDVDVLGFNIRDFIMELTRDGYYCKF